jgi:hypothetical protein
MTTITRPVTEQVRHTVLHGLVGRPAAALATLTRRLRAGLIDIAASGQLGPNREIEVGRWTGARV